MNPEMGTLCTFRVFGWSRIFHYSRILHREDQCAPLHNRGWQEIQYRCSLLKDYQEPWIDYSRRYWNLCTHYCHTGIIWKCAVNLASIWVGCEPFEELYLKSILLQVGTIYSTCLAFERLLTHWPTDYSNRIHHCKMDTMYFQSCCWLWTGMVYILPSSLYQRTFLHHMKRKTSHHDQVGMYLTRMVDIVIVRSHY